MSISKDQWAAIGRIVLVALVALAAVFGYDLGVVQPREALQRAAYGSQATSRFTSDVWLQNSALKVDKTLAVTGVSTLSGGVTGAVTGDVVGNVTGNVTVGTFNIHSSVSITPTEGMALAPTAERVTLTPAGALTFTLAACTTGQSAIFYNSVNASILITDSTNFLSAGDQTLTQYDTLQTVCIGSKWVQVSAASAN